MTFSVLIVDDSAECRHQARACLTALGVPAAAIREAEHGALARFYEDRVAALIRGVY